MQERGRQIDDGRSVVTDHELRVAGEGAKVTELNTVAMRQRGELGKLMRVYCNDHAFLCFAEPDLPRRKTGIFEWHEVELDIGADTVAKLANRR